MINFDIDWHGPYNRRSALVDFIEVAALRGHHFNVGGLADTINDCEWYGLLGERIRDADHHEFDDEQDGPEDEDYADELDLPERLALARERAQDVVAVLSERATVLGDSYPFRLDPDGVELLRYDSDVADGPYLALLCLAVCHACDVRVGDQRAAFTFEDSVELTLNARGLATAALGRRSRGEGSFEDALRDACSEIGAVADPARSAWRRFANDEGSDTVSSLWPQDPRLGGFFVVGQATCAKSSSWARKLKEPPRNKWRKWLQREIAPLSILSIPHHVESDALAYLYDMEEGRDIVDRLRLATVNRHLSADEVTAIRLVREELDLSFDLVNA